MIKINVTGQKELQALLENAAKKLQKGNLIEFIMFGAEPIRKEIKVQLRKQGLYESGNLEGSWDITKVGEKSVWIFSDVVYAPVHEYGALIHAKNAPLLKFQIDGDWVSVPFVLIPARPYARPGLEIGAKEAVKVMKNRLKEIFG